MNIAYFGSPEFSAKLLDSLCKQNDIHIKLVVTQRDKPAGRHLSLTPTAVKTYAQALSVQIVDNSIDPVFEKKLMECFQKHSINLCIVFAYGTIIQKKLLSMVKHGFWNIHPSLLPKYRGAAPMVFPIALGDAKTGVTLIKMNEAMDEGDIIDQTSIQIDQNTTRIDIEESTIPIATEMVVRTIQKLQTNKNVFFHYQDHAKATYTRRITKQDGYIPLDLLVRSQKTNQTSLVKEVPNLISAYYQENKLLYTSSLSAGQIVWNLYKALIGWPGIWTVIQTAHGAKQLKINKVSFDGTSLILESVQLEGKKEVAFDVFNKAYSILS